MKQTGARSRAANPQAGGARHNTQLRDPVRARSRRRSGAPAGARCVTRCYVEPALACERLGLPPACTDLGARRAGAPGPEGPGVTDRKQPHLLRLSNGAGAARAAHGAAWRDALPATARKARDRRVRACGGERRRRSSESPPVQRRRGACAGKRRDGAVRGLHPHRARRSAPQPSAARHALPHASAIFRPFPAPARRNLRRQRQSTVVPPWEAMRNIVMDLF